MNGDFVKEFKLALHEPQVLEVDGKPRLIAPMGWQDLTPAPARVEPLRVGTLTGLVDYVRAATADNAASKLIVHVKDPGRVEVRGPVEGEETRFRQQTYLVASTDMVASLAIPLGQYLPAEHFFIGLQAGCEATPDREEILTMIAAIRENSVRETTDDGVAQSVNVQQGVTLVGKKRVPNPVQLRPYRTFREVEQPESFFILRLQADPNGEKPKLALFEADGGVWKLQAISHVADYLRSELRDRVTVIA